MKKEKRQVIIIQWEDSCIMGSGQFAEDDESIKLAYGFSAGVLVKETKDFIAICLDCFDTGDEKFRSVHTYPKSGIKSIKRFNFEVKNK